MRPSLMMYARSVTDNVSRTLWSVIKIPIPLARRSEMIFCKSKTAIGSIPENGSASKMNVGLMQSDRAISTPPPSPQGIPPILPGYFQPQLINQFLRLFPAFMPGNRLNFQHGQDVVFDRQFPKNRCLLREIADAVLARP